MTAGSARLVSAFSVAACLVAALSCSACSFSPSGPGRRPVPSASTAQSTPENQFGWPMQLMFLGSMEQTRAVADGVYLARISSAASGTTDIWVDWEGKPGGAGTSITNASRFRQRLSVMPPAVVFTLSGGGGPERTFPPQARLEIASTPAFFTSLASTDAAGTAYRNDDWWITVSSGQCIQIVQAIR